MSVGFADKDKGPQYYAEQNYVVDKTEIGYVYYPRENVEVTGEIVIRYEKLPWISRFEIDGIKAIGQPDSPDCGGQDDMYGMFCPLSCPWTPPKGEKTND